MLVLFLGLADDVLVLLLVGVQEVLDLAVDQLFALGLLLLGAQERPSHLVFLHLLAHAHQGRQVLGAAYGGL